MIVRSHRMLNKINVDGVDMLVKHDTDDDKFIVRGGSEVVYKLQRDFTNVNVAFASSRLPNVSTCSVNFGNGWPWVAYLKLTTTTTRNGKLAVDTLRMVNVDLVNGHLAPVRGITFGELVNINRLITLAGDVRRQVAESSGL